MLVDYTRLVFWRSVFINIILLIIVFMVIVRVSSFQLEWKSRDNKISCYCHDITDMVFSNSFFAPPNAIDFSTVFLKFSPLSQAAVMGTLCAIFLIYIIAAIYLAGRDRHDQLKVVQLVLFNITHPGYLFDLIVCYCIFYTLH